MAMTCQRCNAEIQDGETLCPECGAIHCSLCGNMIQDGETKCSLCETPVEIKPSPAPVIKELKPSPAPVIKELKPAPAPAEKENKFVCSGCGKEYPAGTKFCAECGGKVEEKKPVAVKEEIVPKFVCTACGKEYPAGTKFCSECGGKVEEVKPAAPEVFACVGCGKEYPAGTKFCAECGGKVAEKSAAQPVKKIVCTKCGKEYPDGGKFCSECGGKIEETIINNGNSFATANTKAAVKQDVNGLYDVVLQNVHDENKADVLLMLAEVMAISNQEAKKIVDTRYLFEGSVLVRENCSKEEAESLAKKIKFACFEKISIGVECKESSKKYLGRFQKHVTIEAAREMVEHGVDLNGKYPPLHDAIRNGDLDIVKYLVSQGGADVNAKDDDGETPLYCASGYNLDIVKYLVSQGADVNARKNNGFPLFLRAVVYGNLDIVKCLVSQGADVNAEDNDGETLLHRAAVKNNLDIVKYLVSQGANVNAENNDGWTPLHWAAGYGFLDIVKYLVSQGADVNAESNHDETPLHCAAYKGELDTVKYLVSQGADVNAENDAGETPLDEAIEENEDEIAEFLKQHGAVADFKYETTMTAAEIVEEYFPSSKMKFSSTAINFAPNFSMCTTPPHEDTIAIVSDEYRVVFFNKAGIYIRARKEGPGSVDRFMNNLLGGKVKDVDLAWQDIYSIDYSRSLGVSSININQNFILSDADAAATEQFANNLKNYAREQGAKL